MKQFSIFPEDIPDQEINIPKRRIYIRKRLLHYLAAEGFYNYAQLAEQLRATDPEYLELKYKIQKEDLLALIEGVFGEVVAYQETIDSFLFRTRNEPGYSLTKIENEKPVNRKRRKRS